jgi:hypothetical protein
MEIVHITLLSVGVFSFFGAYPAISAVTVYNDNAGAGVSNLSKNPRAQKGQVGHSTQAQHARGQI